MLFLVRAIAVVVFLWFFWQALEVRRESAKAAKEDGCLMAAEVKGNRIWLCPDGTTRQRY